MLLVEHITICLSIGIISYLKHLAKTVISTDRENGIF